MSGHAGGVTDDSAFGALYEAQYEDLLRYALRRVDQPADAADIVAETWAVAWRRRHVLPPVDEQRLWLFGTARRVLANHRRGRLRASRLSVKLVQDLQATPRHVPQPDEHVGHALSQLSERDREVLFPERWAVYSVAFGTPLLAFLGVVVGHALLRRTANELDVSRRRSRSATSLSRCCLLASKG